MKTIRTFTVNEARDQFHEVLRYVDAGDEVITAHKTPVAKKVCQCCRQLKTLETQDICLYCVGNCVVSYVYGEGMHWKHSEPEQKGADDKHH